MKNIKKLLAVLFACGSIGVLLERPIYIVGEYPKLTAFLTLLMLFVSIVSLLVLFASKKMIYGYFVITFMVAVGIVFIPALMYTGNRYEKAKSSYLLSKGTISKAVITDKKQQTIVRRGRQSTDYQLYFSYSGKNNVTLRSWDDVSLEEYGSVNIGDSIDIISSLDDSDIVDLIIAQEDRDTYQEIFLRGSVGN